MARVFEYISIEGFRVKITEKKSSHKWRTPSKLKWLTFCENCGLVHAKNDATRKAIKNGCIEVSEEVLGRV